MNDSHPSKIAEAVGQLLDSPLTLPNGSSFILQSLKVGIREILDLSERSLPASNARPDFGERKKRTAIPIPFVL
jgi:hypothetical protein